MYITAYGVCSAPVRAKRSAKAVEVQRKAAKDSSWNSNSSNSANSGNSGNSGTSSTSTTSTTSSNSNTKEPNGTLRVPVEDQGKAAKDSG